MRRSRSWSDWSVSSSRGHRVRLKCTAANESPRHGPAITSSLRLPSSPLLSVESSIALAYEAVTFFPDKNLHSLASLRGTW